MPSVVAITSKTVMESNDYGSIYDFYFGGREGGQQYEVEGAGFRNYRGPDRYRTFDCNK